MKRAVVIGGGVSGLTAAHRLKQAGLQDILLFEASSRLGGNIVSLEEEGFVIDSGPDSWVAAKPQAAALCRELGLGDRLIGTQAQNRRVYVLRRGRLIPMPEGLVLGLPTRLRPFLKSELLSLPGKIRALSEVVHRQGPRGDISVAAFLEQRFGKEMTEVILEPLLGGIFSGDGHTISLRAAFPQLAKMAEDHGSLLRAAGKMGRARASGGARSPFLSLKGGMGELLKALEGAVGGETIRKESPVSSIRKTERGFELTLSEGETIETERVIVALPAHAASRVLASLDPELSHELYGIPYVSTATVTFAYRREDIAHPLDATGFIVPHSERQNIVAGTFISSKWEGRAPEGRVLLRGFLGGGQAPRVLDKSDDRLVALAQDELQKLLGISKAPLFARVARFDRASPQPTLGHLERMERIRSHIDKIPGLFVIGNAYEGVGIPDCIRHAESVALQVSATSARS